MSNICIVLTSDYSNSKDPEAESWQKETDEDMATIRKTMKDYSIIEIKIDATSNGQTAGEAVDAQISQKILQSVSSCHIIINSHGNITRKDLQDNAVKRIIELVSEHLIPITQLTALICYAMAEDNYKAALERIVEKRGHTATGHDIVVSTKSTAIDILIKKIEKLNLPIQQNFKIWGPIYAYNPFEEQTLVAATLNGLEVQDANKVPYNLGRDITIHQLSIQAYKEKLSNAISWLREYACGKEKSPPRIETIKNQWHTPEKQKIFFAIYNQHVTLLGKVLDELFSNLDEIYKQNSSRTITNEDICHFLHQQLLEHATTMGIHLDNPKKLKQVYSAWKRDYKANSAVRLAIYDNYINYNNELFIMPISRMGSRVETPPSSPNTLSESSPRTKLTESSIFKSIDFQVDKVDEENPKPKKI